MRLGIGDKPAIGLPCKLVFGPAYELATVIDPGNYVSVVVHHRLFTG